MKNADAYKTCISNANLADTGFSYTLSLINGKYKMTILYTLMSFGVVRFNEMKKYIGNLLQNPQLHTQGAGGRPVGPPGRIPPDPAQGGIQSYGARQIFDSHSGSDV